MTGREKGRRGSNAWTRRGNAAVNNNTQATEDEPDRITPVEEPVTKKRKESPAAGGGANKNKKRAEDKPVPRTKNKQASEKPRRSRRLSSGSETTDDETGPPESERGPERIDTERRPPLADKRTGPTKQPATNTKSSGAQHKTVGVRKPKQTVTEPGRAPQPAALDHFFGGSSERLTEEALKETRGGSESVPRADYSFLQSAYQGVQEQNNRLTKLLENLTETHDRVCLERAESTNESKRLVKVCVATLRKCFAGPALNVSEFTQRSSLTHRLALSAPPPLLEPNVLPLPRLIQ